MRGEPQVKPAGNLGILARLAGIGVMRSPAYLRPRGAVERTPHQVGNEMTNQVTAVLEPAEEGGYFAYCPELPEANGQGESKEEALENLREAIALVLEDRREQGLRGIPNDADTTVVTVG